MPLNEFGKNLERKLESYVNQLIFKWKQYLVGKMPLNEFGKLEDYVNQLITKNKALLEENQRLSNQKEASKEKIKNILKSIEDKATK